MTSGRLRQRLAAAYLCAVGGLMGCEKPASEPADAAPLQSTTLALAAAEASDGIAVDLAYARSSSVEAPRMAEVLIEARGPVVLERSERLDAATRAGKDVVVQPQDDGRLRVLIFTTQNLDRLDSGPLARLHLRRTGPGPVRFELVGQPTIFAPPEANTAVTLGPAVNLP